MKDGGDKKWLIAVLVFLIVAIVGLVIGIVVVKVGEPASDYDAIFDVEYDGDVEVAENELREGETMEEAKERKTQEEKWKIIKNNVESEVDKLLSKDTVDLDAINKIYNDGLKKAEEEEMYNYVFDFTRSRYNKYLDNGLKREALDALINTDYGIYDGADTYRAYSRIIRLANEIGDTAIAEEYKEKRKDYEAAFQVDYELIEASNKTASGGE